MLRIKNFLPKLIVSLLLAIGIIVPSIGFSTVSTWTDSGTILTNTLGLFYTNVASVSQTPVSASIDSTVLKRARVEATPETQGTSSPQGDTVYLNHILKNIGNASDTFYFSYSSVNGWAITIIDDANQDGIHQSTETSVLNYTPLLNKNDTYSFFVSVYVPLSAGDGVLDTCTVHIISGYKYPDTFTVSDTIFVDSPPSAPQNLRAEFYDTYILLSWEPPADTDVIGYNVYKSTNGGAYQRINSSIVTDTQYVDTDLVFPNNYYYKVRAVDSIQEGLFSDSASAPYLTITKSADVADTQPGGYVTFSISVENIGYAPAQQITIIDTISSYTVFDTATKNNSSDSIWYSEDATTWYASPDTITVNYVKWESGIDLNSGDTAVYTLKVRIKW